MDQSHRTSWPTLRGYGRRDDPYRNFLYRYHAMLDLWPAATTEHVITRYGRTAVTVAGREDAPPLVLLHGTGATSTVWYAMAARLAGRFRIYAVDQLGDAGLGGVDRPIQNASELVDWLDRVLTECGLDRSAVVGHGAGGWLALRYALDLPDRVAALGLLDPIGCFGRPRPSYRGRALGLLLAATPQRARSLVRWESAGLSIDEDWLELFAAGTGVTRMVSPRLTRPTSAELRSLAVPTMIMLAGMSRVNDARRTRLAILDRMPAAQVAVVGHASHYSMPYEPAGEISTRLASFLRS